MADPLYFTNGIPTLRNFAQSQEVSKLPASSYRDWFHEYAKVFLYDLFQLSTGSVLVDMHGERKAALPYRLTPEQWDLVREAGAEIWAVVQEAQLERTPISKARDDAAFRRFLRVATTKPKRRRRG